MAFTCRHNQHGSEMRHCPPHEICQDCRALSCPPGVSDFWCCCECLSLNAYNLAVRRTRLAEDRKRFKQEYTRVGIPDRRSVNP